MGGEGFSKCVAETVGKGISDIAVGAWHTISAVQHLDQTLLDGDDFKARHAGCLFLAQKS